MSNNIAHEINKAIDTLKHGGTILYPTDTIWGIGCDATNETAVSKVSNIKGRKSDKRYIVLLTDVDDLGEYVDHIPPEAFDLIAKAERPLTIIYEHGKYLPKQVIGADGSIAIRIVKEGFCAGLLRAFGKPLLSSSANLSGSRAPAGFQDIPREIKDAVDYIIDNSVADTSSALPSKIVRVKGTKIETIRA